MMRYGRHLYKLGTGKNALLTCREKFTCAVARPAASASAPVAATPVAAKPAVWLAAEPVKVEIDDTNDRMHEALAAYLGQQTKLTINAYKKLAKDVQTGRVPPHETAINSKKKYKTPCRQPWLQPPRRLENEEETFWPQGGRPSYATLHYSWKDCFGFEWFNIWVYGGS
jgi:hypothetical protein